MRGWQKGSETGGAHHFVMAHLTKQRQLTFLVLCHIWYSRTSLGSGCKGTITPPLSLSLLSVVRLVALEESGEEVGKGVGSVSLHSRQPMPFECKASAAANPPLVPPSATATAATLLLFRRISQLFLDGQAKPSKDLHWRYVIKTRPPPRAAINIKIKELYADKWAANE